MTEGFFHGHVISDSSRMRLTFENKITLALLIRKKKEMVLGPKALKNAKDRVWDEIYKVMLAQGAPIRNMHHLRKVIFPMFFLQVNKCKFAYSNENSYSKEIVDLHGNTHLCQCLSILVSFVMFWYMPFLALCSLFSTNSE